MQYDARFLKGVEQFNQGLFYECHETIEEAWLEEHGDERELYQGVIQVAAGYFKWQQDVPVGAVKLLRSGLGKLEPYAPQSLGLDIASFLEGVASNLTVLEASLQTGGAVELEVPQLCFSDARSDR